MKLKWYMLTALLLSVLLVMSAVYPDDLSGLCPNHTSLLNYGFYSITSGDFQKLNSIDKFGRNADIDTGTAPEDVWTQGDAYSFLSSETTLYISSSDNSDTQEMTVMGLDGDYNLVTQTKDLTGQSQVALDTDLLRVFRCYNSDSTVLSGNIYIAESDTLTDGVPDTPSKIKAVVSNGHGQTQMAIYTIPAGKTGYLIRWYVTINDASGSASKSAQVSLKIREFGKVFRDRRDLGISSNGGHVDVRLTFPIKIPEKSDIKITVESAGANDSDVSAGFDIILVDN